MKKTSSFKKRYYLIFLISLLLLTTSCSNKQKKEEKAEIRPVKTQTVYTSGGNKTLIFSGESAADLESNLSFKVSGTIKNILVDVGDKVKKGQILALLDAEDYQLKVQEIESALAKVKAQNKNAKLQLERIQALYENENVAKRDYDTAKTNYQSTKAGVSTTQKQLEQAKRQLQYTYLYAPYKGAIAKINIEKNENIQAGQPLIILTSGKDMIVKTSIPETLISKVYKGQKVTTVFDAIPNKEFSGIVKEVGVSATKLASTFPVTIKLQKSNLNIRPGMVAEVSFPFKFKDGKKHIFAPSNAVNEDNTGTYAYLVKELKEGIGIAKKVTVNIGEMTDLGIEITKGLTEGDILITAGINRIQNGQKVRILN